MKKINFDNNPIKKKTSCNGLTKYLQKNSMKAMSLTSVINVRPWIASHPLDCHFNLTTSRYRTLIFLIKKYYLLDNEQNIVFFFLSTNGLSVMAH